LNFNNFWYNYSWYNWPSSDYSSFYLTQHMLRCTTWGNQNTWNRSWNEQKMPKVIRDCNLEKNNEILIVLCTNISGTSGHQMAIQIFSSHNICFCIIWRNNKCNMSWNIRGKQQ